MNPAKIVACFFIALGALFGFLAFKSCVAWKVDLAHGNSDELVAVEGLITGIEAVKNRKRSNRGRKISGFHVKVSYSYSQGGTGYEGSKTSHLSKPTANQALKKAGAFKTGDQIKLMLNTENPAVSIAPDLVLDKKHQLYVIPVVFGLIGLCLASLGVRGLK